MAQKLNPREAVASAISRCSKPKNRWLNTIQPVFPHEISKEVVRESEANAEGVQEECKSTKKDEKIDTRNREEDVVAGKRKVTLTDCLELACTEMDDWKTKTLENTDFAKLHAYETASATASLLLSHDTIVRDSSSY